MPLGGSLVASGIEPESSDPKPEAIFTGLPTALALKPKFHYNIIKLLIPFNYYTFNTVIYFA